MSMKVLRCLGIRKRHMARKSPCFLRFLSSRSGPNVPHFFLFFFFTLLPSHGFSSLKSLVTVTIYTRILYTEKRKIRQFTDRLTIEGEERNETDS